MPNITLAMDKETLDRAREYARKQNISVNAIIRRLLRQTVDQRSQSWVDECFHLMDRSKAKPAGRWKREDLYDV